MRTSIVVYWIMMIAYILLGGLCTAWAVEFAYRGWYDQAAIEAAVAAFSVWRARANRLAILRYYR